MLLFLGASNPNGEVPIFRDLQAWKCRSTGVYFRGNRAIFDRFMGVDNGVSIFVAFNQVFRDSLIVATSRNHDAADLEWRNFCAGARCNANWGDKRFRGALLYDGPLELIRVNFVNFPTSRVMSNGQDITPVPILALGAATHFESSATDVAFSNEAGARVTPYYRVFMDDTFINFSDFVTRCRIRDLNGSLFGVANRLIVPIAPLMWDPTCTANSANNVYSCNYEIGVVHMGSSKVRILCLRCEYVAS